MAATRHVRSGKGRLRARLALALLAAVAPACGGGPERPPEPAARSAPKPRLAPELRSIARALDERRHDEARALARAHLDAHPGDAQACFLLGMSHHWTDNHGAARPWLERAVALDPSLHAARERLAYSLFLLGELDAARREYETYVEHVPGDPKGFYGLGLVDLEETHLAAAAARFRRALELFARLAHEDPRAAADRRPEHAECHARLGEVHFARDELELARTELLRATELWPGNISAFYTLSLVHRRLGAEELADEAARKYESARQARLAGQPGKTE